MGWIHQLKYTQLTTIVKTREYIFINGRLFPLSNIYSCVQDHKHSECDIVKRRFQSIVLILPDK